MGWVALVAAKNAADSIGPTVVALAGLRGVDEVWVIDDGSTDATAAEAERAGARSVRLATNLGKGGALAAGVAATTHATHYLLADADLGATAAGLQPLIDAHERSEAALIVGVLPSAEGRGGFGTVKRFAAAGIRRACGLALSAPLSGQRTIDGGMLQALELAGRFGVEVGMTIDVVRGGGRVVEIPVDVDHRHTGRSVAGFAHRARQGRDIVAALVPRLTTVRQRKAGVVACALAAVFALSLLSLARAPDRGRPLPAATKVVLFAFANVGLGDLGRAELSALNGLVADGAAGALSVRTTDRRSLDRRSAPDRPSSADAFASLGASARVRSAPALAQAQLSAAGVPAAAMQATRALAKRDRAPSLPGALGDRLHAAGKRTAFIGAPTLVAPGRLGFPAAGAVADRAGRIDAVNVSPELVEAAPGEFGSASISGLVTATAVALRNNDVVLVDPGQTARADDGDSNRDAALRRTDAVLAGVRDVLPPGTTLLVFAATPPGKDWELTPLVVRANGGEPGVVASPSTRRGELAVITDLAPTVLSLLGIDATGMTGAVLRLTDGTLDTERFLRLSDDGAARSRFFLGASVGYTVAALAFYALVLGCLALGFISRWRGPLRLGTVVVAAFPFTLLVTAAVQHWAGFGGESPALLLGLCVVAGAIASRGSGLRPLYWLAGLTIAVIAIDVAATGPLHTASLLGYSLQTTGRFYGLPNASFSVFAASLLLLAAAAAGGLRPPTAVRALAGACVLGVGVVVVAAPWMGNDVGGTLALVPVAAALVWQFSGRRFSWRAVMVGGLAVGVVLALLWGAELALSEGTHLERSLGNGDASFTSTLTRRFENNFGLLLDQWWGFLVMVVATGGLVALAQRRLQYELPIGTPLRGAVAAAVGLALLAFLVNDSGPVVAVLCLVVVAPVLALRAIDAGRQRSTGR